MRRKSCVPGSYGVPSIYFCSDPSRKETARTSPSRMRAERLNMMRNEESVSASSFCAMLCSGDARAGVWRHAAMVACNMTTGLAWTVVAVVPCKAVQIGEARRAVVIVEALTRENYAYFTDVDGIRLTRMRARHLSKSSVSVVETAVGLHAIVCISS